MNRNPGEAAPRDLAETYQVGALQRPLTKAQLLHLDLLATGLTGREAADLLCVNEETVYSHRKSLIERLGANNATHAVTTAFLIGILPRFEELDEVSTPRPMMLWPNPNI